MNHYKQCKTKQNKAAKKPSRPAATAWNLESLNALPDRERGERGRLA
ncbi:hypothetical protein FPSE_01050 [Fusarium pseudograminearum CS3096]|uniref:Uncharacterized protein n=1 Tax=Fusarium pseudograminearum (strain CS3096) TaxID=1028729 RepID=K3V0T7_FUSPC|nr:hypothetical protein FPSE_01050 [Fusarium pseudograminearum CS3096]EKJ78771.1 hypothetical protein FPSE_01050 [Fusarium pseudograminearum CS3096]